jgi:sarcosine oxidase
VTGKFDVIVIGLGAVGSATTFQLARRGARVLGIDRFAPPHKLGSSHGETRITRLACGEGAVYTQFARRSHEIWRELERETGEQLLLQNGLLVISGKGERASAHGNPAFLQSSIDAAVANGVVHEVLPDTEIRHRFPAFKIADGDSAYYEPESGILFPERGVRAQLQAASRHAARLQTNEIVERFNAGKSSVEVVTDKATYTSDKIVVSAGPWLPDLLPKSLSRQFTIRRQVLLWFALRDGEPVERYKPDAFPVFYWQLPRKQALYGFPWIDTVEPAIKVATEQYDTTTTAQTIDRNVAPEEIAAVYNDYVADFMPGVSPRCIKSATCMYTCTDDTHFVIDALPGEPRVIVASPCSGHGFKHSPAIGEGIAELLTQGRPSRVSFDELRWKAA